MRRHLYIPEIVRNAIREHVERASDRAAAEYWSAAEDEDVMTGHFGARLQIRPQTVLVTQDEIPGEWRWSITYRKFRGRGPRATEKLLGADGIFELTLDRGYRTETKSLLFQAKMEDRGGRKLFEQCIKLSTWREAALVVEYAPSGFNALAVDHVVGSQGRVAGVRRRPLRDVIGRAFVDCDVGDNDLRYDAKTSRLSWRSVTGEVVATVFRVEHRLRICVQAPQQGGAVSGVDRVIQSDEIHQFRMDASDQDILGVQSSASDQELKAAHRQLARAYHPDRLGEGNQLLRDLLNRRTQEINDAFARFRPRKRGG